ncbi:hypothetical protein [Sabulibacter ruber]|uniref:hypothetical protein n=1 Tax=Sabulibacter ruber TaxID=2811901 RepID=UPI001A9732C9|nr:hypothetical protein [Sabulibacter ruber]
MKKLCTLLTGFLFLLSCTKEDPVSELKVEDEDWLKLEIPNGREAYAIAGDIDNVLLVSTWTKAYYTADKGKTWQEAHDFSGPVPGLFARNDTIFALKVTSNDAQGQKYATLGQFFTPDFGKTWHRYYTIYRGDALHSLHPIGIARSSGGVTYRIKENTTPVSAGSATSYLNPSEIIREDNAVQKAVRFPFKHIINNLHVDGNDRLYVAASGGEYLAEKNTFRCCAPEMPAIIYVSKKPLP